MDRISEQTAMRRAERRAERMSIGSHGRRRLQKESRLEKYLTKCLYQSLLCVLIYLSLLAINRFVPETYSFVRNNLTYNMDLPYMGQTLVNAWNNVTEYSTRRD